MDLRANLRSTLKKCPYLLCERELKKYVELIFPVLECGAKTSTQNDFFITCSGTKFVLTVPGLLGEVAILKFQILLSYETLPIGQRTGKF
jgi:hypothetical protein